MPNLNRAAVSGFLAANPLLDQLPESELAELAANSRQLYFAAGDTVFEKGLPGTSIYWVVGGRLKLTVTRPDGSELLHSMIEPGDYCGEITAIDGGVRGVTATADRSTDTLSIDREFLLPAIERNPKVAVKLTILLCAQIRIAGETLRNLVFHGAETRIWSRLMYLSKRYGEVDSRSGALQIKHRLSQQSLADSVGLTRVMVNRQLSIWRELGLIEDGRGFVSVLDPEAFESFVFRRVDSP